ncbi:unnamed protein product [Ectocarpus sp. 12 AP-2014]
MFGTQTKKNPALKKNLALSIPARKVTGIFTRRFICRDSTYMHRPAVDFSLSLTMFHASSRDESKVSLPGTSLYREPCLSPPSFGDTTDHLFTALLIVLCHVVRRRSSGTKPHYLTCK